MLFYLIYCLGVVFSTPQLYQDEPTWPGECATGLRQSPIHLDSSMIAEVHAPIDFRNYFNGHFNKVNLSNGIFTTLISLPIVLLFYSDIISNIFIDLAFERINYQQRNFRWVELHIPNNHHYGQFRIWCIVMLCDEKIISFCPFSCLECQPWSSF